jgi:hypothetical protein
MGIRSNLKIALWLAVFCAVTWWATNFIAVDGCLDSGGMVISHATCEGEHDKRWNMFEKLKPLAFLIAGIVGAAAASTATWILSVLINRGRPNAA